jgi:hypothetical protein
MGSMDVKLRIGYEVNAEGDETADDEQRMMDAIGELVDPFVQGIVAAANHQGLSVTITDDKRQTTV